MRRFLRWFVLNLVAGVTTVLCRIEKDELEKIPADGPMILAMNQSDRSKCLYCVRMFDHAG